MRPILKYNFTVTIVVIACIVILSCCKKAKDKRLQGVWKEVDITNVDNPKVTRWVFDEQDLTVLTIGPADSTGIADTLATDSCRYILKNKIPKIVLITEGFSQGLKHFNTEWEILTLDNDIIFMVSDNRKISGLGLIYKELYKDSD